MLQTLEESGFEGGEFLGGVGGLAELVAEAVEGVAPDVVEGGLAVGEVTGVSGEEW